MPRYDFKCRNGHKEESVQGMATEVIPCPVCGAPARRSACYTPYLRTETGVRMGPRTKQEALNKHGQIRLSSFVEAQHEMIDRCERQHIEPPDTLAIGKQRARQLKQRGVTSLAQIE
jgi:hypothetical protein